jgi:nitronate monooxygenase
MLPKGSVMIHTPLCDLLEIAHPILNAPMGGTATAELAAAVSAAGGFGMLGGTSGQGPDWLRNQIRATRARTNRPFGVGFISSFPGIEDLVQVALDERVRAINHSFADPSPYVSAAHAAGVLIFAQVQSVSQAQHAAQAGVDLIVAQGTEAGGHTGTSGTLALLPAVIDAVSPLPVVAAGGIADGRGLAAVLLLGACGAWLGTRFVASTAWGGSDWEQQAVLAASADDTLRTNVYDRVRKARFPDGIADRVLRNTFNSTWQGREEVIEQQRPSLQQQLEQAAQQRNADIVDISAGVSAGLIYTIEPVETIIATIIATAEQRLRAGITLLA